MSDIMLGLAGVGLSGYGERPRDLKFSSKSEYLTEAISIGATYFDAAEVYGDIHAVLADLSAPYSLDTKISNQKSDTPELIYDKLRDLLTLFQDKLRTIFFHNASGEFCNEGYFDPIFELFSKVGLGVDLGVSVYNKKDLEFFARYDVVSTVQVPASVFDISNILYAKQLRGDWKVVARSLFLRGFLLAPHRLLRDGLHQEARGEFLTDLKSVTQFHGDEVARQTIAYFQHLPEVDRYIVATSRLDELRFYMASTKTESKLVGLRNDVERLYTNPRTWLI